MLGVVVDDRWVEMRHKRQQRKKNIFEIFENKNIF